MDKTKATLRDQNHHVEKCQILLRLAHLFQIACPLKSLLFICSCQKHCGVQLVSPTRLPLIAAHFCGECLHMCAPTCANGTMLL